MKNTIFTVLIILSIGSSSYSQGGTHNKTKPDLYIVSIGVPTKDLLYTRKDAEAVFNKFRTQIGVEFDKVSGELLVCKDNTDKAYLATALEGLSEKTWRKNDLLVLFISGHGSIGPSGFGLVCSNVLTGASIKNSLLYYQQDIIDNIKNIPCRKLILIDACHSGSDAKNDVKTNGSIHKAISLTPPDIISISSSSKEEESYENAVWGNGAFTRVLLDGLDGNADKNPQDGTIKIQELSDYLVREVPVIVKEQMEREQHPVLANPIKDNFTIYNYENSIVPQNLIPDPCDKVSFTDENEEQASLLAHNEEISHPNFAIQPKYDYARQFSEGLAAVELNGSWGFINRKGQMVIKNKYTTVKDFKNGFAAICQNKLCGLINPSGEVKIPLQYEENDDFSEGLVPVMKEGLWGFIDLEGETIIPFSYGEAKSFSEGLAPVSLKSMVYTRNYYHPPSGEWQYINKKGEVIIASKKRDEFTDADPFINGLAKIRKGDFEVAKANTDNGFTYGYINKKGEQVAPEIFYATAPAKDGKTAVSKPIYWTPNYIMDYVRATSGVNVFKARHFHEGLAAVQVTYNTWGYANEAGEVVIPSKYEEVSDFSEGIAVVSLSLGFYRYFINKAGQKLLITPPEKIYEFKDGIAPAAIKDKITHKFVWGFYKNPLKN